MASKVEGDGSHGGEVYRFSDAVMQRFNESQAGNRMCWYFFVLAVWFLWEQQTLMQAQSWLTAEFPEQAATVNFKVMVCTTVPQLVVHVILSLTGIISSASWRTRIFVPSGLMLLIALFLIKVVVADWDPEVRLRAFYGAALVQSVVGSLMEPALYEMAGLLPSTRTTQMVQVGIGSSGTLVAISQTATRLATNGTGAIGKQDLRTLTIIFLACAGLAAVGMVVLFVTKVERNPWYKYVLDHVEEEEEDEGATHVEMAVLGRPAVATPHDESASDLLSSISGADGAGGHGWLGACRRNWRATMEALRHMWPSVLAITIVFWGTLTVFPVIPGMACVHEADMLGSDSVLQSWWFDFVLLAFNVGDVCGKCLRSWAEWGARSFSPSTQVGLAVARNLLIVPLIIFSSAPQLYDPILARWAVLAGTYFVGVSNGYLATICFMRGPKALPPTAPNSVAAQASSTMTMGLFLGIALGCMTADKLASTVLQDSLGKCFAR